MSNTAAESPQSSKPNTMVILGILKQPFPKEY